MFWTIGKFEAWYQLRSPYLWLWALLSLGLTASIFIFEPMRINLGTSIVLTSANGFFPLFAGIAIAMIVPMTGMMGPAVVRDVLLGSGELLRATRLTRSGYVFGRFAGAFGAIFFVYALHVPVVWLAAHFPGLPVDKYPSFDLFPLLQPAAIMATTLLVIAAIVFGIGTVTRSALVSYIVVALLIAGWIFALTKVQFGGFEALRNGIDWTGISSVIIGNQTSAIHERNTDLLVLTNDFYANRALWLGVGLAAVAIAWLLQGVRGGLWGNRRLDAASGILAPEAGPLKPYQAQLDYAAKRAQFSARVGLDLKRVLFSPAYAVLMVGGLCLVWLSVTNLGIIEDHTIEPVTRLLAKELQTPISILLLILAPVFASELVWGDTDRKIHELVDVTPTSNWAYVIPKVFVIYVASLIFIAASCCVGMAIQAVKGFPLFEVGKLTLWLALPMAGGAFCFAVLGVACQCLSSNKIVGWGVYLVFTLGAGILSEYVGWDHALLGYGFTGEVPLSDFNGQAQFWANAAWLDLHWTLVACVLIILSVLMWRRGSEQRLKPRLALLPVNLRSREGVALAVGIVACVASGSWIFYNINVLGTYLTEAGYEKWQVANEQDLAPLEGMPGPTVTGVTINVDIRPKTVRATANGVLTIENRTAQPLDKMVFNHSGVTLEAASMPGATRGEEIKNYGVEIWTLTTPLKPGESRQLTFETSIDGNSVAESNPETAVVPNGSFIDSRQLVPTLRIDRDTWLTEYDDRKNHKLPEKRPVPTAMLDEMQYTPGSGWIDADITISTDTGQIPIAPGLMVAETIKDGRTTRRYKPPVRIVNMFSLQSANYMVKRDTVALANGNVALEIYYLPGFTRNLDWMMTCMKASLKSLSSRFGDYPFQVLRIVQTPGYNAEGFAAQALAGTVPFYEDGGWLQTNVSQTGPGNLSEVIAHEVAHMWWGHQVAPSNQPGALLLTESLAELSSWVVATDQFPALTALPSGSAHSDYEFGRGQEKIGEPTLAQMDSQKYLAYDKGPLALSVVRDQIGHAKFDAVLKSFVARFAFADAPFPNAQDLLTSLREAAPPSLSNSIRDLFEDRVKWKSEASKLTISGTPATEWRINVSAAAWTEHLDAQGKVERAAGIKNAELSAMKATKCSPEYLKDVPFSGTPDEILKTQNACAIFIRIEDFRADFRPSQTTYTFRIRKTDRPVGVQFGNQYVRPDDQPQTNSPNGDSFFPPQGFLPLKAPE
jgi:ABC-2 type transport system permease protein